MKKFRIIFICLLACAIILGGGIALTQASSSAPSETNPFVSNYYVEPINQDAPFFDVILPEIAKNIEENNTHSISPYYDALPEANNPENFQGLGSTTYANINGKVVTAEAFYRVRKDSLGDPNNGMGLLIYQCIQYKRAHPEEDVKITFSSYRTSVTASVCVLPESKYYGYMRSLYGTNYDEHGFVRISYMLTEAARMGIEVTLVNQLNSYGVKQYNPSTGKLQSRGALSYTKYFGQALESDCYNSYAPGKKVSDFMNFVSVDWTVTDQTANMQHVKSASVSHYLATDGTEHTSAVYFGSTNLDENDYIGANGNSYSQSGVIISDHDDLYRVTYNYMQLMSRYDGQEELQELRKIVNEMNNEQIALIQADREDEIPSDEQIVYLGSENDPVFELYFTPFGGGADAWDTVANPFCKYVDKFSQSTDYVELIWNEFGYSKCNIGKVMEQLFEKVYCENPDIRNKIAIRVTGFNTDAISQLDLGTEIGYRSIKDGTYIHSKDILMSYEEDGVRHNVSLMTSCNFYMIAFSYRTNSLLVINETEESGGNFYEIMCEKYSYGMLDKDLTTVPANLTLSIGESYKLETEYTGTGKLTWTSSKTSVATVSDGVVTAVKAGSCKITVSDGTHKYVTNVTVVNCKECDQIEGLAVNQDEQYILDQQLPSFPVSFEAVFTLDPYDNQESKMTLFGNDGLYDPTLIFYVNKNGHPGVQMRPTAGYNLNYYYLFDQVTIPAGEEVHLAITMNLKEKRLNCFVNGELVQTIKNVSNLSAYETKYNYLIGGDLANGNISYFPGVIKSIAVWSDQRVSTEIANDYANGFSTDDKNLMFAYDFTTCQDCNAGDLSGNGIGLEHMILWQDEEDVEPVGDYDYSFAVVGDTQYMMENDPDAVNALYQWILANKDQQKIEYVIGLGDITNHSTDREWEDAVEYIGQLNNEIPYLLVRGNHDDWDDFNRNLHNGFYENTVDGMMVSGNIKLTDPDQPGLVETVAEDGTITILTREKDVPEGGTVKGDLTNSYRYFSVQGTDYLFLTLDFAPNSEMLEWANSVIAAHPNHRVIVVTHAYMYRDGTTIDAGDCYPPTYYTGYDDAQNGDDMWEKCFSQHENVVMVLSGHDPWQHIVYRQDEGVNGNTVTQMLIDPQYVDSRTGSTGMVAMFYFSNNGNTLTVRYYSVEKDCYGSVASQFTIDLN